jgi:hypothetical protein
MSASVETKLATRSLTAKERQFVLLILQGNTKSSAYRRAYRTHADPHVVSTWASRVARRPPVKAALMLAQSGSWGELTSCGIDADFCTWKKLIAMGHDPGVAAYVQVRALRAAGEYRAKLDLRAKEDAEAARKLEGEEIEQLLRSGIKDESSGDLDDDFSLDSDPLPSPRKTAVVQSRNERPFPERFQFRNGSVQSAGAEPHPFLTNPYRSRR